MHNECHGICGWNFKFGEEIAAKSSVQRSIQRTSFDWYWEGSYVQVSYYLILVSICNFCKFNIMISFSRDVVIVDKSEQDFMKTLKAVNDILINHFEENIITCIAGKIWELIVCNDQFNYMLGFESGSNVILSHLFLIASVKLELNFFFVLLDQILITCYWPQ